jgi:hypothetical protein
MNHRPLEYMALDAVVFPAMRYKEHLEPSTLEEQTFLMK